MDKKRETVSGQTMPPYVDGKTGRIYFNFAVGEKYEVYNYKTYQNYVLEVLDCAYLGGREYYTVARDGRPFVEPCSANRLRFLLTYDVTATLIEVGERREIPLTQEEIRTYFFDLNAKFENRRREALKKLEGTDYKDIEVQIKQLIGYPLSIARERKDFTKAAEILGKIALLENRRDDILKEKGIEEYMLNPHVTCNHCNDTGIYQGKTCDCAIAQTEKIKEHCANKRLSKR